MEGRIVPFSTSQEFALPIDDKARSVHRLSYPTSLFQLLFNNTTIISDQARFDLLPSRAHFRHPSGSYAWLEPRFCAPLCVAISPGGFGPVMIFFLLPQCDTMR